MRNRLVYLLKTYLWTMLVFIIGKIVFLLYNMTSHSFTIGDVVDVIWHGMTLDLSVALYFICLPLLLVIIGLWINLPRIITLVYAAFIAAMMALAFVIDTSLYPFWGFKLNNTCLQYLETPKEAFASVSIGYLLLRLIAIVIVAVIIYLGYPKRWKQHAQGWARILESGLYLLFIPFIIIGIRGGLGESTTNVGQVFYSQNLFLNHAAINPIFSFFSSFEHGEKDYFHYNYFDDSTCQQLVENVYTTESVNCDTLLNTQQPDIIIILMESCGSVFTAQGGREGIMPNLDRLAKEGVFFTQCYANSWRTDRGAVCTLSGWPSFPNVSVMKMPDKSQTMPSLAKTLKQQHYNTSFLYGGDINFTNMRGYLMATGWDSVTSIEDFTKEQQNSGRWGVRDDITFDTLYRMVTTAQHPFLFGYLTLSSHEPWDVPVKHFDDEILNAFYYLDQCIGTFINKMKKTREWDNLLIVMLADHGYQHQELDETNPLRNLIPVIWTGGAIKAPRRIETICNQSDLAATLLGQLGLSHKDFTFSRDVLSQTYRYPLAVHNYNNAQSMIDSTGFILYDFDAEQFLKAEGKDTERMQKVNKAILQKTTNNLKYR